MDDIFGQALLDYHRGDRASRFQWERSDGVRVDQRLDVYYDGFHDLERWALDHLRGAVLDIGCGAGKHALECRRRGLQCFGYDISPRAVEVCRTRGLSALAVADAFACRLPDAVFDCVTLFSNNLSIGGTVEGVRALLGEAARVARPGARMISINRDPAAGRDAADRAYRDANQRADRPAGQILMRGRYKDGVGPWFDWLFVSPDELSAWAPDAGWEVDATLDGTGGEYCALLERRG